jgi:hypothetical protein
MTEFHTKHMVKCYQIITVVEDEDLLQKMVIVNPMAKVFKNAVVNTILPSILACIPLNIKLDILIGCHRTSIFRNMPHFLY